MQSPDSGAESAEEGEVPAERVYVSKEVWSETRPTTLVVACSDGRLQESIDDFLLNHLGVTYYDRLYAPGGPGVLASSGYELFRSEQFRRECTFLLKAHSIEEVVLIFHGAVLGDGPEEATCADYRRKMPGRSPEQIAAQQEADMADVLRAVFGMYPRLGIHAYRAEVTGDDRVRFVELYTR